MPPIEVPYQVEIRMKATPLKQIAFPFRVSKEEGSPKEILFPKETRKEKVFKNLIDYALDRKEFLEKTTVEVSATVSQWWPGGPEPFLHLMPENLIDGYWGPRSQWIDDSWSTWIILDLHRIKSIGAVIWGSVLDSGRVPSTYSFFASRDGVDWQKIKRVEKNNDWEKIEIFDKPIEARYLKMVIDVTSRGDFALLEELEIVGFPAAKIFNFYQDREKLIQDSQRLFSYIPSPKELDYALSSGIKWGWGALSWETNTYWDDSCFSDFLYLVDGEYHTYTLEIRESERYSSPGEFLAKFLTKIKLDLGEYPAQYEIDYIKLKPKYKIAREKDEIKNP
ncbi:discoidin domain-containing protein [bacterium]|nr:discoidin domain-containing protein [bacterium]